MLVHASYSTVVLMIASTIMHLAASIVFVLIYRLQTAATRVAHRSCRMCNIPSCRSSVLLLCLELHTVCYEQLGGGNVCAGQDSSDQSAEEGASNSADHQQGAIAGRFLTAKSASHGGADQQKPGRMGRQACLGGMGITQFPTTCRPG